jgi:dihydrofolate reductase
MATVIASLSMSLDGYIADPNDNVGPLFDWYEAGDVAVPTAVPDRWTFHTSEASAAVLNDVMAQIGALITGRRLFDHTNGWDGMHPFGAPVYVVTHRPADEWVRDHPDAPFTFVGSVEDAVEQARATAGDCIVGVAGPNIAQQCLNAGLLDELSVDLVPVLLGEGIPFFANMKNAPVLLDDPDVVPSTRVTHLRYRVRRATP